MTGGGAPSVRSVAADEKPRTFKDRLQGFIGYDPVVVGAASTTDTVLGGLRSGGGVGAQSKEYVKRLFPFHAWILHYNPTWALGDLVAGLTVGMVLVPQSMSYAKIASLDPEYGLYSSFVGVMVYALFATSKDVTIGPVAVMSLETSKVIAHVQSQTDAYTAATIATCLAFMTGFIVLGIGLLRLGWIIEFIPAPAVAGFMTGSAITIAAGQVPSLLGYSSKFDTRAASYKVIINSFKFLPSTKRDAAFGLSGLFFLYFVRWALQRVERRARSPLVKRLAFFALTLRTAIVIIFLTLFSWVHLRGKEVADYDISILKTVPSGFQHMGRPNIDADLISKMGSLLPVSTIILLLEHIAIAKSFGRINNYKIDPNQELIAIGVANTVGTLFNAYPATGSFSRSAIKAKAGVRTPLAGWVTGVVVVVALYALTGAFYWIPNAALSAVIIHAVGDLIASPAQVYGFWKISPIESLIWFGAVILSIFTSLEIGIYFSVGASVAFLLYRIARPRGQFLGRVRLREEEDDLAGSDGKGGVSPEDEHEQEPIPPRTTSTRDVYVPIVADGVRNPHIRVEPPPPGVLVFRFDESLVFPNASYFMDLIVDYAHEHTRSGQDFSHTTQGQRPWNDPGPSRWAKKKEAAALATGDETPAEREARKPVLRAVVFDMSCVSNLDTTSVQNLVDLRRTLERFAAQKVTFHFCTILSPWIRRALLAGGFGTGRLVHERPLEIAATVPAGTELVPAEFRRRFLSPPGTPMRRGSGSGKGAAGVVSLGQAVESAEAGAEASPAKLEAGAGAKAGREGSMATEGSGESSAERLAVPGAKGGGWEVDEAGIEAAVVSTNFPRFHLDVAAGVQAAVGKVW